jgi:hypothetical protein
VTEYSDEEWGLLVGLPQAVAIAASAAEPDGVRRTWAEGAAGQQAIAAGRESGSGLVEKVAGELVSRIGDPDEGAEPTVVAPPDRRAALADVIERARAATAVLGDKADPGDAAAYKHWPVTIAEEVVTAARSGGVFGVGGDVISESERRFRDELAAVLGS